MSAARLAVAGHDAAGQRGQPVAAPDCSLAGQVGAPEVLQGDVHKRLLRHRCMLHRRRQRLQVLIRQLRDRGCGRGGPDAMRTHLRSNRASSSHSHQVRVAMDTETYVQDVQASELVLTSHP